MKLLNESLKIDDSLIHTSNPYTVPKCFVGTIKIIKDSDKVYSSESRLICINNDLQQTFDILYNCKIEFVSKDSRFQLHKLSEFIYGRVTSNMEKLDDIKITWTKTYLPKKLLPEELNRITELIEN